jgi:hypothetical protein
MKKTKMTAMVMLMIYWTVIKQTKIINPPRQVRFFAPSSIGNVGRNHESKVSLVEVACADREEEQRRSESVKNTNARLCGLPSQVENNDNPHLFQLRFGSP